MSNEIYNNNNVHEVFSFWKYVFSHRSDELKVVRTITVYLYIDVIIRLINTIKIVVAHKSISNTPHIYSWRRGPPTSLKNVYNYKHYTENNNQYKAIIFNSRNVYFGVFCCLGKPYNLFIYHSHDTKKDKRRARTVRVNTNSN